MSESLHIDCSFGGGATALPIAVNDSPGLEIDAFALRQVYDVAGARQHPGTCQPRNRRTIILRPTRNDVERH
jgi:hypothetical protein